MSIITAHLVGSSLYSNEFFSFDIQRYKRSSKIVLKTLTPFVKTETIPATRAILKNRLPSVFRSKCFNENNYSFSREVRNTEIGHLFEHIILEYLSEFKCLQGAKHTVYNGLTSWNWVKEERGIFHIEIDAGYEDREIFNAAIQKSTILLEEILLSANNTISEINSVPQASYLTIPLDDGKIL